MRLFKRGCAIKCFELVLRSCKPAGVEKYTCGRNHNAGMSTANTVYRQKKWDASTPTATLMTSH